ncbi:MAG: response regulator transcription factor [Actinomycetes bacterium]
MRLLLCDDHTLFNEILGDALADRGHEIVGMVSRLADIDAALSTLAPDVCLLDTNFPRGSSLDLLKNLVAEHSTSKIMMLSADLDPVHVGEALRRGAHGYAHKGQSVEAIAKQLDLVMAGQIAIDPCLLRSAMNVVASGRDETMSSPTGDILTSLTVRESEVLRALVAGMSTADIAKQLGIARNTARAHVQTILNKLHCHSRLQAVRVAVDSGLVA